jgi:hypothetical protein
MPTKNLASSSVDDLRSEYDLDTLKARVQGKYYARATAGTTMVLLEPDVAEAFPDGMAVNQALRAFLKMAPAKVRKLPDKRLQPTAAGRARVRKRRRG